MKARLKTVTVISCGLFVAIALVCFSLESYWPFAPYIDTRFSEGFSAERFEAVQIGASVDEVQSVLGVPIWKIGCGGCWEPEFYIQDNVFEFPADRSCDVACDVEHQRWQFSDDGACTWWDFAWKYYAIDFSQGRVVAKYSQWHWD